MGKPRVLIVDDEEGIRRSLRGILEDEGYEVEGVATGEAALERLKEAEADILLLDILLPGISGLDVLHQVRRRPGAPKVVMISGHGTIETAVEAIKAGAYDFVEKPLSLEKTVLAVRNALRQRRLEEKNRQLREIVLEVPEFRGVSAGIVELRAEIERVAPTNARVLIIGENGTGKELVARHIHRLSARADEPFVEVNCAAIPEELIESELFGHLKGSFTGAVDSKRGRFAHADGGTLFLDEVGDMSLRTQAKVLRVLEEQRFQPVGSEKDVEVDVRVISATNKDLPREIERGNFREDLYFRLNVVPFFLPPLRERTEDVPLLVGDFLEKYGKEHGVGPKEVSAEAMEALRRYRWPGNVRELRNIVERLVIMSPGARIDFKDLPAVIRGEGAPAGEGAAAAASLREARERFEKEYILKILRENGGNVSRTAEILGMERSTFYRKIRSFGLDPKTLA